MGEILSKNLLKIALADIFHIILQRGLISIFLAAADKMIINFNVKLIISIIQLRVL
jgi:hypothetical protein